MNTKAITEITESQKNVTLKDDYMKPLFVLLFAVVGP